MHETHLMKQVVRMVEDRLREISGARPLIIRVQVNAWSHLANQVGEADAPIHWAFAQAAQGTAAEGARLELTCAPSESRCPACGVTLNAPESDFICPACGGMAQDADAELVLQEIVIEEDEILGDGSWVMADAFPKADPVVRMRVTVDGIVQGVGFRPYVRRLADRLAVAGWIRNTSRGALLEAEGPASRIERFMARLEAEALPPLRIDRMTATAMPVEGQSGFEIQESRSSDEGRLCIPPDLATCGDCRRELLDPTNRRFRYPFLSCTRCGPRFSLITGIPYDRGRTTMHGFSLCGPCRAEYDDQQDRRFHAEPTACSACGPSVAFWNEQGHPIGRGDEAIQQAIRLIREGGILAVKGLGGFQMWVDAHDEPAVQVLRRRKRRPDKPFAVLFPSLDMVQKVCQVSSEEAALLASPQAPIVLLRKHASTDLAASIAPGNSWIGAMLPYTPLHHLLMYELNRPVIATSGNRADEPIVIDERDALERLRGIPDAWLVHDRPIARPVDDSVVRIFGKTPPHIADSSQDSDVHVLRRARGYAPHPMSLDWLVRPDKRLPSILTVGGHLKNTIACLHADRVVMSQHLGDLSTMEAFTAFQDTIKDFERLLAFTPQVIACDLHPEYRSSQFAHALAQDRRIPVVQVQHHHAHVTACMTEHHLEDPVLGVAWDGAGFGTDGTIWGGEFLLADYQGFRRLAHLRPFRLPGGEQAFREPRRSALAVLDQALGDDRSQDRLPPCVSLGEQQGDLRRMLRCGFNAPWTSSVGRLFDAVASLLDLCQVASFEGQAAMAIEGAAEAWERGGGRRCDDTSGEALIALLEGTDEHPWTADWRPLIGWLIERTRSGWDRGALAYAFHRALADLIARVARSAGISRVVLTGGVFQNALLTRLTRERLENDGFSVYTHRLVPANDGGIALGQAMVAAHQHR